MSNGEGTPNTRKPRILVVDDDGDFRATLAAYVLEPAGYDVVLAASVAEAVQELEQQLMHLAIVDLCLEPGDEDGDSGLELCRRLEPTVPRIVLTAHPQWNSARKALEQHDHEPPLAQGFIPKGDPESMLREIQRVLKSEYEVLPDRRIAVLTSGGDSPGMNAAVWAVVRAAMKRGVEVLGVDDGYRGLHRGWLHKLTWNSATPALAQGGTFLGTARFDEFRDPAVRRVAVDNLIARHVSGLVVIGGDGSMNGATALAADVRERERGFKTVAIPGTIDNDLFGTQLSLGAATATNAIANELRAMIAPASALRRIFVCEVMGRYSGYLALEAALAVGADIVLIPEESVTLLANGAAGVHWTKHVDTLSTQVRFLEHLTRAADRLREAFRPVSPGHPTKRHAFVIVAEGVRKLVGEALDVEHIAAHLQRQVNAWGLPDPPDVRPQVLGYPVRGASPCRFDMLLGLRLGAHAVECLLDDRKPSEVMVGLAPDGSIQETPFDEVVAKSNRPPAEVWADRPRWKEHLALHEMLTRLPPPIVGGP